MIIVSLLIYLLVIGCLVALVFYVVGAIPVPEPLGRIIKMVAVVLGVVFVILVLLQLVGGGPHILALPL